MFNASDIIGKKVISLYECEFIGTVNNIYLNKKRNKIVIFEIINNNDEKQFLSTNDVFSLNDAVIIKSSQNLITEFEFDFNSVSPVLINKEVFSEKGSYFGRVRDIVLKDFKEPSYLIVIKENESVLEQYNKINQNQSETFSNLKSHETQNNDTIISSIGLNEILRNNDVIFLQEGENKINFSTLKPKIQLKRDYHNQKVYTLTNTTLEKINALQESNYKPSLKDVNDNTIIDKESINTHATDKTYSNFSNQNKNLINKLPTPILSNNYNFLIGRKSNKNIFANNNEIIIKKNSKITQKHIDTALNYNKLRELATHSF